MSFSADICRERILHEIAAERRRQDAKWGGAPGIDRRDDATYAAVLGEEFGEVCKAWLERDMPGLREELVHVAAVAVAWAQELDLGGSKERAALNVKRSKLQRKYVRAMDQLADVPRPARRFKYPPTFGNQAGRATYPIGRLARYVRRANEVTARLTAAQAELELERRQQETKRALDAARKRERRERFSLRGFVGRRRRSK